MFRAVAGAVAVAATIGFPAIEAIATHTGHGKPVGAPSTPSGCYPQTNKGNCYEPGELCRKSDHGASGVAGDGKSIVCQNNDGWRWEPAS
jgi:hypothetical protein